MFLLKTKKNLNIVDLKSNKWGKIFHTGFLLDDWNNTLTKYFKAQFYSALNTPGANEIHLKH